MKAATRDARVHIKQSQAVPSRLKTAAGAKREAVNQIRIKK